MYKTRLLTLMLALALALATAPAVMAQDESPAADDGTSAAFDPSSIPEVNQDEALIVLHQLRESLLAAGIAGEDLDEAVDWLAAEAANLSEADVDELLAGKMLADSEAEAGDDEFGKAEEDEPEIGDGEEEEDGE